MASFDKIQTDLQSARTAREDARAELAAARETIRRIEGNITAAERSAKGRQGTAELARLKKELKAATAAAKTGTQRLAAANAKVGQFFVDFAVFTDPRKGIAELSDTTPILMMPVRLETRFKGNQLWVRVFPDDCLIDTFDPVLTETEVKNAQNYWTSMWKAGRVPDLETAAWAQLVERHGAGRAGWMIDHYAPVNLAGKPSKPRPDDLVLTIASAAPLTADEEKAAAAFWLELWRADGNAQQMAQAQAALELAIGAARAAEIARDYVPENFAAPLPKGKTKDNINVSVAVLYWPNVETKQASWSQAPKAPLLPDRFVFLGYDSPADQSPLVVLGHPVPSPVLTGPDPAAPPDQQLKQDADGNLVLPDELLWLRDFDRAVEMGLGFRIDLTEIQAQRGFKRVLVLGLRLSADANTGQAELESLVTAHAASRSGLEILPLGTPTNNAEDTPSGASRRDDPAVAAQDRKQPLFSAQSGWLDKSDGQWLAEWLGINPALLHHVHAAGGTDQAAARAMNEALWPATLGYWMQNRMAPVFSDDTVARARSFFTQFVLGGGACPSIRIGMQPYGILPVTAFSRMNWIGGGGSDAPLVDRITPSFLPALYRLILAVDGDFRAMAGDLSYVGKSGDPHKLLLDIVGLHPGSVEWSQRYAESLQSFFNRASLQGLTGFIEALIAALRRGAAAAKLNDLGYRGETTPPILDLIFNGNHNLLKGGVVQDGPLSETDPLRGVTTDQRNYLQWLTDAANTSLDALYRQDGFASNKVPTSLLYLFLRHALQLGYSETSRRLYFNAGLYDTTKAARALQDSPFLHISQSATLSESRYQPLYANEVAITGSASLPIHAFIGQNIASLLQATGLKAQLEAIGRLKDLPTARLERAFADHMDCCSYRLDAWLLGLVSYQLAKMRNLADGSAAPAKQGVYLGAYAWLEDLKPDNKLLTPVTLADPDLVKAFGETGAPSLVRDSTNQGHIHAPSLNHAVAAAVLRNGYISNASTANPNTMAVNLTSERVRTALSMIEGIRAGQSLSDLLGYQIERGLHDRHGTVEVDRHIYTLRKAFPLRADRIKSTKTDEGVAIEAVEARNVINGLSLVEQVTKSGKKTYPFGRTDLPDISDPLAVIAINEEVDRALEANDAVADLALSEGVYQAVIGNYDRVASTYDAYARGHFPPEPEVCRTPIGGIGLTHRVALHLDAAASPAASPVAGVTMTPRAQGEPALNHWLATILPALDEIGCMVDFREAASNTDKAKEVTLKDLGVQPADIMRLIRDDHDQAMTELDDRVVRFAVLNFGPRPDNPMKIRYMDKQGASLSVFEVMPLVRNLQRLIGKSRPLLLTDASLSNEAKSAQDGTTSIDKTRLDAVFAGLSQLKTDIAAFKTGLDPLLAALPNRRGDVLTGIDTTISNLVALLARAGLFALPQSGWGFAYDARQRAFAAAMEACNSLVDRWTIKLAASDQKRTEAAAATAPEEKLSLLAAAEREISTGITVETNPVTLAAAVTAKRTAFVARHNQFKPLLSTTRTTIALFLTDVAALQPVAAFDFSPFVLTAVEDDLIRLAQDASGVVTQLLKEIDRRLALVTVQFGLATSAATAAVRVKALDAAARALLGEDFRVYPVFSYAAAQATELGNAVAASTGGSLFSYLTAPPDPGRDPLDFPVDTWLYSIARVREKMFSLEQIILFSSALGGAEPALTALQLPFDVTDKWLAMEFPPDLKLDHDRLLYTAHLATPFAAGAAQCGLLIDEWTETIPTTTVDTAVALHHDRPNNEAPQTMLLVTPSAFRGAWQWADLVDALNETLDLAKRRAIEPKHLDATAYAPFLPATVMATQAWQLTMALDLGFNNKIAMLAKEL
jgi:hypothetical protein